MARLYWIQETDGLQTFRWAVCDYWKVGHQRSDKSYRKGISYITNLQGITLSRSCAILSYYKSAGMLTDYVNKFSKIKQEASGWPKWCKTDDDKRKYIRDCYNREGIWLNANNKEKNPGLWQLAKLMLNSFYGKCGQRTNLPQNTYVSDVTVSFEWWPLTIGKSKMLDL